jgi:choline dehydrogenase-like flavoprotein
MIFSMEKAARDGKIESDICIIGSGAAALSIAKEFLHTETRICILESGDTNIRRNPDPLYEFESPLLPVSLNSRVRTFGGTTTIWSGRWRELDAIDFTARDWVPFSGWPITYDEIEPYYVRALKSLSLDLTTILPRKESIFSAFKDSPITSIAFRFQDNMQRNWGPAFHTSVEQDKNISVYLGAHVTHMDQENRLVKKVHVHTDGGNSFTVRAKFFVLATGGIENPRLLLLSDIGNSTDQVGRYYMDYTFQIQHFSTIAG